MIKKWKAKRKIKKLEEMLNRKKPVKVTLSFSEYNFKEFERSLEEIASVIAFELDKWKRNIENELESLKQDLHR